MSFSLLERNDSLRPLNSYTKVYKTNSLYKMKFFYRKNILRIVKKSLLGSNFIYFYSKHGLFISTLFNILIININLLLFPRLLSDSKSITNFQEDIDNKNINEKESTHIDNFFNFNLNEPASIIYKILIINSIDFMVLSTMLIHYKYKERKINKYMQKYTQCSIESENRLISKKYFCTITNDGNFKIEINKIKNKANKDMKRSENFFEYVINFPNIRFLSLYLYKKIFLPKEKEIINKIIDISNEIEYKYKKKLLIFLIVIISIITYIPLVNIFAHEERKDFINYFGILVLILYVERNNFFNNKNEQIQRVSLLNMEYINSGYYIYISNDLISIFYIKEKYRNIESIDNIKKMNENFLHKFDLI
jgi:hypothetical protein